MKVLTVGLARSIWLFDMMAFNSKGLSLKDIFEQLTEKYQFAKSPKNVFDLDEHKGLKFEVGRFVNSRREALSVGLHLYNNGIVGDALSSTKDSDEFLADVINWVEKKFGLSMPKDGPKKVHLSQIDFESDMSFVSIHPKFASFVRKIQDAAEYGGEKHPFDVGGFQFWTEDINQGLAPGAFRIERRYNYPFSSNRYFSQAPCGTDAHIKLIEEFESLVRS